MKTIEMRQENDEFERQGKWTSYGKFSNVKRRYLTFYERRMSSGVCIVYMWLSRIGSYSMRMRFLIRKIKSNNNFNHIEGATHSPIIKDEGILILQSWLKSENFEEYGNEVLRLGFQQLNVVCGLWGRYTRGRDRRILNEVDYWLYHGFECHPMIWFRSDYIVILYDYLYITMTKATVCVLCVMIRVAVLRQSIYTSHFDSINPIKTYRQIYGHTSEFGRLIEL